MRRGRITVMAAEKHSRLFSGIGLALSVLFFCNGCMTQFRSTSFDMKPRPASSISTTRFRVTAVVDDKQDHDFEKDLKTELEKLERHQDQSLIEVPYSVELHYLGYEETSDTTKTLMGVLWLGSCFVLPLWDTTTHMWDISTVLPGETVMFRGEKSATDVASWFMLPLGLRDMFSSGGTASKKPSLAASMAKAIFDSLTKERYDSAIQGMEQGGRKRLLSGKKLSETDKRLLEDDTSPEALAAWAKRSEDGNKAREALRQIDDPEMLGDVALHASKLDIREEAARRVEGLPEERFAQLAVSSADLSVAETFLARVSDENLLHRIVCTEAALPGTRASAVRKIKEEAILASIAKMPSGPNDLKELAVGRIGTESVLADIAAHASVAEARKAAIGKISKPSLLLASVMKDSEQENRLAALERLDHPKAFAYIMKESGDAAVRLQTLRKIGDPALLKEVATGDADEAVRLAALEEVTDQAVFAQMAETDDSTAVRSAAIGKLTVSAMLARIAKNCTHEHIRLAALEKVTDATVIDDLARSDSSARVRLAAVAKTGNQDVLAGVVRNDSAPEVRLAAVRKLQDKELLADVARRDADSDVRMAALGRIDDPGTLQYVAEHDRSPDVRRAALPRVSDQGTLANIAKRDTDTENRILAIQCLNDETILREIALNDQNRAVRNAAKQALPESSRKALLASLARNALARAKHAQEDGLINFCGFYVGMPLEDANLLMEYYGLREDECKIEKDKSGTKVEEIFFLLAGIRRVTNGGNTFDELVMAVSSRIGYMEPKINMREPWWNKNDVIIEEHYEYNTIDGNHAAMNKDGLLIWGGKTIRK